jgi:hypothetical protein
MDVTRLRNYGVSFSDAEGAWSDEVKATMRTKGKAVVMRNLGAWDKLRFAFLFLGARRRAARLDLTPFRDRGLDNEPFYRQQLEYLAMFSALAQLKGSDGAIAIMKQVMDEAAREPMLLCLPETSEMLATGDAMAAMREYLRPTPEAAAKAGCQDIAIAEDGEDAFQFDVTWCVWLELARSMGIPEACLPNCYADDLVFPEYFAALGIGYSRTETLASGCDRCNFRFERLA